MRMISFYKGEVKNQDGLMWQACSGREGKTAIPITRCADMQEEIGGY